MVCLRKTKKWNKRTNNIVKYDNKGPFLKTKGINKEAWVFRSQTDFTNITEIDED